MGNVSERANISWVTGWGAMAARFNGPGQEHRACWVSQQACRRQPAIPGFVVRIPRGLASGGRRPEPMQQVRPCWQILASDHASDQLEANPPTAPYRSRRRGGLAVGVGLLSATVRWEALRMRATGWRRQGVVAGGDGDELDSRGGVGPQGVDVGGARLFLHRRRGRCSVTDGASLATASVRAAPGDRRCSVAEVTDRYNTPITSRCIENYRRSHRNGSSHRRFVVEHPRASGEITSQLPPSISPSWTGDAILAITVAQYSRSIRRRWLYRHWEESPEEPAAAWLGFAHAAQGAQAAPHRAAPAGLPKRAVAQQPAPPIKRRSDLKDLARSSRTAPGSPESRIPPTQAWPAAGGPTSPTRHEPPMRRVWSCPSPTALAAVDPQSLVPPINDTANRRFPLSPTPMRPDPPPDPHGPLPAVRLIAIDALLASLRQRAFRGEL